jgi:hypothetical protein
VLEFRGCSQESVDTSGAAERGDEGGGLVCFVFSRQMVIVDVQFGTESSQFATVEGVDQGLVQSAEVLVVEG